MYRRSPITVIETIITMGIKMTAQRISKLDYFVVFLYMAFSGNPLFIYTTEWFAVISLEIMFLLCLIEHKRLYSKRIVKLLVSFVLLSILQCVFLNDVSLPADVNQICKVYVAFLFASFLGLNFREAYLRVIACLSFLSLLLWAFVNVKGGLTFGIDVDRYYSLVLFDCTKGNGTYFSSFIRNSGMFWEPGAFSGFLLLVPLMYIDSLRDLYIHHKKKCLILLAALLSTGSTTGYIVLVCLVVPLVLKNIKSVLAKYVFVVVFAGLAFYAYTEFVFLGAKITSEYEAAVDLSSGEASWSRMGAMTIDWENIQRHPLIGNGYTLESRYGALGELMGGTGNGFTGAVNMFGIPMMLLYLIMLYRRIPVYSVQTKTLAVIAVVLLLSGEYHLNYSAYWALLFIQYSNKKINYETKNRRIAYGV